MANFACFSIYCDNAYNARASPSPSSNSFPKRVHFKSPLSWFLIRLIIYSELVSPLTLLLLQLLLLLTLMMMILFNQFVCFFLAHDQVN